MEKYNQKLVFPWRNTIIKLDVSRRKTIIKLEFPWRNKIIDRAFIEMI